jgi:large repetitive protein
VPRPLALQVWTTPVHHDIDVSLQTRRMFDVVLNERTIGLPGGASVTKKPGADVWSYLNIHGDIVATTNSSGVKQGATVTYDPYGSMTSAVLPDNVTGTADYGWVGQHQRLTEHELTGPPTIEMGACIYQPTLGRFLAVDPIEGGTGTNDYGYVGDPVNSCDLTGEGVCFSCAAKGVKNAGK